MKEVVEGGCHCGAIRFRTEKEPFWVGACYCVDCRKISGAPYTVWVGYATHALKLLQGNPKDYQSSKNVVRSFCETCGSPFSYRYPDRPEEIYVPVGVFDKPETFTIQEHIWISQKLPWVKITDNLSQRER